MPAIELTTIINAPVERCFALATSIDLHMASVSKTQEKAIAGVTKGLIGLNDTVTWQAKHFGFTQHLTSKITHYNKPVSFTDEMISGPFKKLHHQHFFEFRNNQTVMKDIFRFEAPLGVLGKLAETLFLTAYMRRFLLDRNTFLKKTAESANWERYTR